MADQVTFDMGMPEDERNPFSEWLRQKGSRQYADHLTTRPSPEPNRPQQSQQGTGSTQTNRWAERYGKRYTAPTAPESGAYSDPFTNRWSEKYGRRHVNAAQQPAAAEPAVDPWRGRQVRPPTEYWTDVKGIPPIGSNVLSRHTEETVGDNPDNHPFMNYVGQRVPTNSGLAGWGGYDLTQQQYQDMKAWAARELEYNPGDLFNYWMSNVGGKISRNELSAQFPRIWAEYQVEKLMNHAGGLSFGQFLSGIDPVDYVQTGPWDRKRRY